LFQELNLKLNYENETVCLYALFGLCYFEWFSRFVCFKQFLYKQRIVKCFFSVTFTRGSTVVWENNIKMYIEELGLGGGELDLSGAE
jgi:hypothetical protein